MRRENIPMWDKTNLRYNCPYNELIFQSDIVTANTPNRRGQSRVKGASKLAVICEGTTYYISNDWFAETTSRPTKRAFYNFLERETTRVCKSKWEKKITKPKEFYSPVKDFKYKLNDSEDGIIITKYVGKDTEVVIPPKINGLPVTTIGASAFYGCTSLKSISIPKSVTEIGRATFKGCTSLTSLHIPESVTEIGGATFKGCTSLTSISIPESVTEIGYDAFKGCTSLTNIVIPDSVTTISWSAFAGCTSLTSIEIPEGVTTIGGSVFSSCTSLTSITIPESVTSIGDWAFEGCTSLTSIVIPEGVATIGGGAFNGCSNLSSFNSLSKSFFKYENFICEIINSECISIISCLFADSHLVIPEMIENLPVTEIGKSAFAGCKSLQSIVIPEGVTTIGVSAFAGCTGLQSIVIPESVTTIGVAAFYRCNNLEWVYIKKFDWTVKDIIDIFGTNPKFKFFRTQQELDEFLNSAENPDE